MNYVMRWNYGLARFYVCLFYVSCSSGVLASVKREAEYQVRDLKVTPQLFFGVGIMKLLLDGLVGVERRIAFICLG